GKGRPSGRRPSRQSPSQLPLVEIVHDGTGAEIFLLRDQPAVEYAPLLLGRDAEAEMATRRIPAFDQLGQQKTQRVQVPTLLRDRHVLGVHDPAEIVDEHPASRSSPLRASCSTMCCGKRACSRRNSARLWVGTTSCLRNTPESSA